MKTKLFFLAFLTSLLSWGQATLPVSRTSNWNTATVTGWTHTGTTDRTSTFACSGGNAETFDTTGDRIVLFVNAAPNQLIFKLKSASMSGASSLLVEQSNDGSTYTTLGNYGTASGATTITDCADITLSLNNATRYIRWTYTRSSGNVDIDDVSVSASAGPAPILAITPATTNLGTSCVGTPTTAVTYTITNSGTVDATGVTVMSSGTHNTNFVVSGFTAGSTITAGNSATYTVTFTPSATGTRNATITVASTTSGSNTPSTALTGTGTAVVAPIVNTGSGATPLDVSATLNGTVTNLGTCPAVITKGFVYSQTAVNGTPTNGGTGVTTTPGVAVGGTGAYSDGITGLTPNTNYSYRSYVFDGTTYTYSSATITFTTRGVPVVSNGAFSGNAGAAITTFNLSTLATNSPFTGFAITGGALPAGLSLNTTTGAITGTPTVNGSFSINFTATNSIGTSATSGTVTITINPSQNSDIVTANGEAGTISSLINNTSIATDTQGVQVWQFTIRDGGAGLNDADNLATILTALNITSPFGTADFNDIQTAALFDGATKVSNDLNFTNTGTQLQFTGLNVNVADNTAKTLSLRISLKCPLSAATIDGDNFGFRITNGNTTFSTLGSGKSSFTNTSSINNAASVNIVSVEATELVFTAQPPGSIGTGTTMPTVVVTAQDACGNRDYDYAGTVTLTSSGTMTAIAPVVAVDGVASFNPVIHTAAGSALNLTAAGTLGVSNAISNPFDIVLSTAFSAGDFAVLGVRSNLGCVSGGSTSQDEVSFITFREIINGDTFYITDNGFEKQGAGTNTWGNNEGLYQVTRTGGTIAIGTVITFILDSGSISFSSPDSSWSYVRPTGFTGNINLNANGDQLFFMQGGVWNNPGGTNDATYTGGTLLFAFNTNSTWTAGINTAANNTSGTGNAQNSGLPPEIKCFSLLPGSATDFVEYNGPTTITSKLGWIARLNDPSNWIDRVSCAGYLSTHVGQTYSVDPTGTFTDGVWTGVEDTNWFNCSNWDTLKVPDETTNVLLSSAKATQEAVISSTATDASLYGNIAKANNLTIAAEKVEIVGSASNILEVHGDLLIDTGGALDMNGGGATDGHIRLYGDWTNNAGNIAFDEGQGTVTFTGTTPQIISNVTPEGTETFGNLILNNNFDTSVSNNIIAKGNLTINTGRTLTITADDYAEVTNSVFNNGTFNILNDGSLIQVNDLGVNTGNISYERITTGAALDYVYWSSPVNGVSTPASGYNYTWNTTVANPNGGQGNWVSATNTAMQPALGYIMRGVLNRNFIGLPRNGVYTPTIARGSDLGAGSTGPNGIMRLATDDNWNLLGNPYPSAISINSFLTANTQLDGFVRLWTHGTLPSTAIADPFYDNFVSNYTASDYVAINGAGATSGPGTLSVIGAGQGFFVLMDAGSATTSTALFNNSMRDKGYSNSQFYRINTASRTTAIAPSERHGIWLDLVSPTNETTRTLVAYVTDATYGRDRMFDAITDYKSAQNFYSIINEDVMTIQGRPVPFDNLDKVPMGVKIPSTGSYTIAIGAVDGIFASSTQDIYLEDLEFGIIHDLRVNPYSFNATQGIHNSRFVLRYTNSVLGNEDFIDDTNTVFVVSNESLTVSSLKENITAIEIYDVLGRKLYQNKNVNTQSQIVNSIQKTNSGLIIYITLESGKQVVKKAIY